MYRAKLEHIYDVARLQADMIGAAYAGKLSSYRSNPFTTPRIFPRASDADTEAAFKALNKALAAF